MIGLINKLKLHFRSHILPVADILSLLPENTSVLDIGCGQGQLLALLKKFKHPSKLAGVEIDS